MDYWVSSYGSIKCEDCFNDTIFLLKTIYKCKTISQAKELIKLYDYGYDVSFLTGEVRR
jgi:chromosome segregation ATPase